MEERHLVIGLGNPGKTYEDTRHNIGFRVVKALGAKYGIVIKPALVRAKGCLGDGAVCGKKTLLLLPLTYMNESGLSAGRCAKFYQIPSDHLIVIADDV